MSIKFKTIEGRTSSLEEFKGKVILIVNVASECGLTPQYEGLEKLYKEYESKGLVILGFPSNEFGAQEPGSNEEISHFCQLNYGVTFPMFEKIVVKGEGQHPLYAYLTNEIPKAEKKPNSSLEDKLKAAGLLSGAPNDIKWNFEKFLIDKNGRPVARFAPDIAPEDSLLMNAITRELMA